MQYVWSSLIIVLGIYLNVYSKRFKLSLTEMLILAKDMILGNRDRDKSSQQKLLDV